LEYSDKSIAVYIIITAAYECKCLQQQQQTMHALRLVLTSHLFWKYSRWARSSKTEPLDLTGAGTLHAKCSFCHSTVSSTIEKNVIQVEPGQKLYKTI